MTLAAMPAVLSELWGSVQDFAPVGLSAIAVFGGLWLLAVIVRRVIARLLGLTALDRVIGQTRVGRVLEAFGEGITASSAIAAAAYFAVMLLAVTAAADALGLTAVQQSIAAALGYVPRVFSALLVLAIGSFVGSVARRAVGAVLLEIRSPLAQPLETATEFGILLVAGLFALGIVGIDVSFVTNSLSILIGLSAATLCFLLAWAMRSPAVEIIANYYLRRMVRVGDRVELGQVTGVVERFSPLGVVLHDSQGKQHFVPARHVLSGLTRAGGSDSRA